MAKKSKNSNKLEIAAGVGALAALGYVLFGPKGKAHRRAIRGWAIKMKGEIVEKIEDAKELTEPLYNQILDQAYKKYSKIKKVDQAELNAIITDIRKHWDVINKKTGRVKRKIQAKKRPLKKSQRKS